VDKYEENIDKVLGEILDIHNSKERNLQSSLESTYIRSFNGFDKGDRVSMTLLPIIMNGYALEEQREIEGTLVIPSLALVKIHLADGVEQWEGRTVGFATRTPNCFKDKMCKYTVAAKQEVAYFYEEDLETGRVGNLYLPDDNHDEKLHHIPLLYGRVAIGGSLFFDHVPKRFRN
jgi:hypothetical protein